ncbi:MAG: hypothetical protein IE937_10950 [Gammaproteobacteria bacterium]|nr:hypothetical protein [Gammaproteobacteria bacterium]MBD3777445.1 hypothetical protein [Thiotrichales bacterium]
MPPVSTTIPLIIYVLYLLNLIVPITSLVGVVMAYINRGDAVTFLQTHYRFQIRTFWIGLLYGIVGALLTAILIGWLILIFTLVWFIVRCVIGIKYLNKHQAVPDPGSWMFGG